jgi:hypothetical protein
MIILGLSLEVEQMDQPSCRPNVLEALSSNSETGSHLAKFVLCLACPDRPSATFDNPRNDLVNCICNFAESMRPEDTSSGEADHLSIGLLDVGSQKTPGVER